MSVAVGDARKRILLIYGGHEGGRTEQLVAAVRQGVEKSGEPVELRCLSALLAGVSDLLWAQGLLIGTPEHFGYMSGAVKDFMDRTFYPVEGNVGTGAAIAIARIALGYKWHEIAPPLIVKGDVTQMARQQCVELGQTMAAGLALGIF
jgi:multimeric flavodoxin WrbA